MKTIRLFSVSMLALVLGFAFSGVSHAQTSSADKVKVAVTEFTPGPNAPGMTFEAKRHMQASLAYALFDTKRFHVVDVRNTRAASQADLAAINGGASTAAAVKHAGETTQRSTSAMRTPGAAEMHTKAMRPALEKLAATLADLRS